MNNTIKAIYRLALCKGKSHPFEWHVWTWWVLQAPSHIQFLRKYSIKGK